jgi:hypothetical protein
MLCPTEFGDLECVGKRFFGYDSRICGDESVRLEDTLLRRPSVAVCLDDLLAESRDEWCSKSDDGCRIDVPPRGHRAGRVDQDDV